MSQKFLLFCEEIFLNYYYIKKIPSNNLGFCILFIIHVWNNVCWVKKFHNLMICFLENEKKKNLFGEQVGSMGTRHMGRMGSDM